jgi:antitoxin component of RelBE/YafQ-DinJ toxin-antitoxin module
MVKTTLQVPVSKELKDKATKVASSEGFSSLQEPIRVFLSQYAKGNLKIGFEPVVHLSNQAEKRYLKQTLDFEKSRNIKSAKNASELITQLNANKVS